MTSPQEILSKVSCANPKFWKPIEDVRRCRALNGDWPQWCYCPLEFVAGSCTTKRNGPLSYEEIRETIVIGALAAWRVTKGIYRFNSELARALVSTPITGDVPVDVILRIPEWCIWVERTAETPGFFAFLQFRVGLTSLYIVSDTDKGINVGEVPLGVGSIRESLEKCEREHPPHRSYTPVDESVSTLSRILSLVLYLCADEPDYSGDKLPRHPSSPGSRTAGAQNITEWNVGERIGASLKMARNDLHNSSEESSGSSPRPHVRRAHWHTYLTGKGRKQSKIRWVHPILVCAGETIPTIHQ